MQLPGRLEDRREVGVSNKSYALQIYGDVVSVIQEGRSIALSFEDAEELARDLTTWAAVRHRGLRQTVPPEEGSE